MRLPSASLLLYRLSEFPVIDEFIQRLIPSQCLINALTGEVTLDAVEPSVCGWE